MIEVESKAEALEIMNNDPAVKAGIFHALSLEDCPQISIYQSS